MAEYIDREDVERIIEYIKTKYAVNYNRKEKWTQFWTDTIRYFDKKVRGLPAADVEAVKHGRWMPNGIRGDLTWTCSECKTLGSPQWKRCPVCEAKMNGGKEN